MRIEAERRRREKNPFCRGALWWGVILLIFSTQSFLFYNDDVLRFFWWLLRKEYVMSYMRGCVMCYVLCHLCDAQHRSGDSGTPTVSNDRRQKGGAVVLQITTLCCMQDHSHVLYLSLSWQRDYLHVYYCYERLLRRVSSGKL